MPRIGSEVREAVKCAIQAAQGESVEHVAAKKFRRHQEEIFSLFCEIINTTKYGAAREATGEISAGA